MLEARKPLHLHLSFATKGQRATYYATWKDSGSDELDLTGDVSYFANQLFRLLKEKSKSGHTVIVTSIKSSQWIWLAGQELPEQRFPLGDTWQRISEHLQMLSDQLMECIAGTYERNAKSKVPQKKKKAAGQTKRTKK